MQGGVAKTGDIEPLEGVSGEVFFGGFDGVVEVEAVDEKSDAGSCGTGHGGRCGKEKTRRPQPTGGCGAFGWRKRSAGGLLVIMGDGVWIVKGFLRQSERPTSNVEV